MANHNLNGKQLQTNHQHYIDAYMSAHLLLNLLNALEKRDCRAFYRFFRNKFNKFNKTGVGMLDSIYHITLKLLCNH